MWQRSPQIQCIPTPVMWLSRPVVIVIQADMESYADAAAVNALNGASGWNGACVERNSPLGIPSEDDLESCADPAAVNGLYLGSGLTCPSGDRTTPLVLPA